MVTDRVLSDAQISGQEKLATAVETESNDDD